MVMQMGICLVCEKATSKEPSTVTMKVPPLDPYSEQRKGSPKVSKLGE